MIWLNFHRWDNSTNNFKKWGYTWTRIRLRGYVWTPFIYLKLRFAHKCQYCRCWNFAPDSDCYMAPDGGDSRHFPDELQPE